MSESLHYDFRIDAFKPETLPMHQLASYLDKLAALFGHKDHVHFLKVRKGSAVAEILVDGEVAPHVSTRLHSVGTPDALPELNAIQLEINRMLRDNNASATLKLKQGAVIVDFPGRKVPLADEVVVHEFGELDGVPIRVGGKDDSVPVWLQAVDGTIYKCTATRAIARELAPLLFETTVRVAGNGKWRRTADRVWQLEYFLIKSCSRLEQTPLTDLVEELRAVKGSKWNEMKEPQQELKNLRGE